MPEEVKEVKILEKPWVEEYRPQRLDDIVGQDHIVKRLKHYVKTGSMPHLLFAGPPWCREDYGRSGVSQRALWRELEAQLPRAECVG